MLSRTTSTPISAKFSSLLHVDEPDNRVDHLAIDPARLTMTVTPPFDHSINISPKLISTVNEGLDETNTAYNASTTFSPSSAAPAKSPGLPSPGLAPPPTFVSKIFYETVRNSQPPFSCASPSSTGATRGANSSADIRDGATPPLTPMSAPHDETQGSDAPRSPSLDDSTGSIPGTHRPVRTGPQQRSFTRQSFPSPPFYPGRSVPPCEQPFTAPGSYTPHTAPNPGFMGQYISPQPRHSMTIQTSVPYPYSQPFAHPGIHAHDLSGLGLPFNHVPPHPPPLNPGFNYQQAGPNSDTAPGDRDARSPPGYAPGPSSPFPTSPSPGQPSTSASQASGQHMSHHTFPTLHFSPGPSAPGYHGYPPHSYAHNSPGLYSYAPVAYPQPFYGHPSSPEDVSKGTWWFLPSGGNQQFDPSPFPGAYPVPGYQHPIQMNRPEFDPYPGTGSLGAGSPGNTFSASSGQPPPSMHISRRESAFVPPSPVAPRPGPSTANPIPPPPSARDTVPSPTLVKKRAPVDAASASPPANSRKSYHPNPPANRSEWVMWVGNVPSDANHDEVWRFFNQLAPSHPLPRGTSAIMSSRHVQPPPATDDQDIWGGVLSVFLISRSNCAFVNFDTEKHLESAVQHFNGKPLRPKDPRCPRLVCRVRRRDDDLKAGVGGQRGMGLHTRWVAEQKERESKTKQLEKRENDSEEDTTEEEEQYGVDGPPTSPSTYLAPSSSSDPSPPIPAVSPIDDMSPVPVSPMRDSSDRELPRHGSSGERSFASTNSSFLAAHFPQRYFILKSLTQYDLNVSLERGVWATQPHNEGILDKAYRTSKDVFLIFGANKSGEFFGYARMAGPISHNEHIEQPPWASRLSASSGSAHRSSTPPEVIEEEDESDRNFLSPGENRMVGQSPLPVTPGLESLLRISTSDTGRVISPENNTAPAEPHQAHRRLSRPELPREAGTAPEPSAKVRGYFDAPKALSDGPQFALMNRGPLRNTRSTSEVDGDPSHLAKDPDGVRRLDTYGGESDIRRVRGQSIGPSNSRTVRTSEQDDQNITEDRPVDKPEGWGREFKIEWIRTERLPFHRTRHLRNPWNHDREVKVSRDGTELEPNVGQQLLNEWDKPALQAERSPPTSPVRVRGGRGTVRTAGGASGVLPAVAQSLTVQLSRTDAAGGSTGTTHGRVTG